MRCYLKMNNLLTLLEYSHLCTEKLLPAHKLACQIWKHAKISHFSDVMSDMPLWSNPGLSEFCSLQDSQWWERHGINKLRDLTVDLYFCFFWFNWKPSLNFHALPFSDILLTSTSFFHLISIPKASHYPLIGLLKSQGPRGLISNLYTRLILSKISQKNSLHFEKMERIIP